MPESTLLLSAGSGTGGCGAAACRHCGQPVPDAAQRRTAFCCAGCESAFALLSGLGLEAYYKRRQIDPDLRPLRPDQDAPGLPDCTPWVGTTPEGLCVLHLMVEGIHCAACVWLIEAVLARQTGVVSARVNMTTRRLTLLWKGAAADAPVLLDPVCQVGYRLLPYDPRRVEAEYSTAERELLRGIAISGFASANIMLFSVSVWAGVDMGVWTRDLFHWLSALFAFPAVAWCIRPFLRSALSALRHGRTNMDVPITIGVLLATGVSLWETAHSRPHAYFDAAVTLLFFLLVGRYLDSRARGRARSAAGQRVMLGNRPVTVEHADGRRSLVLPETVRPGSTVLVAAGERIGVDSLVLSGQSELETSLLSGETMPCAVGPGEQVFAGTLNLTAPLRLQAVAVGEGTLLAEISRLMDVAEQGRARYVVLADRVARFYAPVVHLAALLTFIGWMSLSDQPWQDSLMTAASVLIITCPCALALAVPVVQVIASGRLLRRGILLKSPTALERAVGVDTVVFDKTGTLTCGQPVLEPENLKARQADGTLGIAASLAGASRHPLARALVRHCMRPLVDGVEEIPGSGLRRLTAEGEIRMGSAVFCHAPADRSPHGGPELWLSCPGSDPVPFLFTDAVRPDAVAVVATLQEQGMAIELLSGDRAEAVAVVARSLGITQWQSGCSPAAKVARLQELAAMGRRVMMVGDGLNDAPALAAADVSLSPSSAADISQNAADVVFQGERLEPVVEVLRVARFADTLVRQNFMLAFAYNVVTIPLAVAGYVTPLVAAVAMSSSSVVVIANALRLSRWPGKGW